MTERPHPLQGLRLTAPHTGNLGAGSGRAVPCAVCALPLPDPPPWGWPIPERGHDVCSFRCALALFERWMYQPL